MIQMSEYKCVIFDLDGTIIDSSKGIRRSIEETIKVLGLQKMSDVQVESCIGPPIQDSFKRIYQVAESEANEMASVFRNFYKEKYLYEAEVYRGMSEFINSLQRNRIVTMIATYKREDYTEKLLKQFGLWELFDYVKGADFAGKLKKLDIINLCIKKSRCHPNEIVMIGDTFHDSEAAYQAGIDFIAVTYGFGFEPMECVNEAVYIAESVSDLKEYFSRG